MLILDRFIGESVTLTDQRTGRKIAEVILKGIQSPTRTALGFIADDNVKIMRTELNGNNNISNGAKNGNKS